MVNKKSSAKHIVLALVIDVVLVTAFAVVGHYTHAHTLDIDGLVDTAWPFLVGLGAAWLLNAAWVDPLAPLRTGAGVWATTVLVGLVVRILSGDTAAESFLVVAATLNLVTLVGWRLVAAGIARR